MDKYKVIQMSYTFSRKKFVVKVENYLNEVHIQGDYDVISVGFNSNVAFITLKKID